MTPLLTLPHVLADEVNTGEGISLGWWPGALVVLIIVAGVALAVMWLSSDRRQNRGKD